MAVGLPTAQWLALDDEALAYRVMAMLIERFAEQRGIAVRAITHDVALRVIQKLQSAEMDDVRVAGMEKAIRKIANGDPIAGGQIFRAFLLDGANRMAFESAAGELRQRKAAQRKNAKAASNARTKYSPDEKGQWIAMNRELIRSGDRSITHRARIIKDRRRLPDEALRSIREVISRRR
jgi:hypothetical protein